LNSAYKQQIELVQEENQLKLKEEECKRADCVKSYQTTMNELSTLLETHTGQNSRLRDENVNMSDKLMQLCQDSEKRENQVQGRLTEYGLQIKLLEHQVMKAQLEKAEVKADMTKERIEIAQELTMERERSSNLEETVKIMKEQTSIYQEQLDELSSGAGQSTKNFSHFKQQIDKLSKQMVELDKDTHQWREKYEVSSQQVKKMNTQSLEREKEIGQLKKKLDQMVKLNKTLAEERSKLNDKLKALEVQSS
jgi:chromosome segregation ATPase